jgi:glycerophosphoryl diester phosphodiesterase
MRALQKAGVAILAPPIWMLLTLDAQGQIVPSDYAKAARASGLALVAWSLERAVDVSAGGGWYYQSIAPAINDEGDLLTVLDVLMRDVGVAGVFSDWPATTTYYAHCMGDSG